MSTFLGMPSPPHARPPAACSGDEPFPVAAAQDAAPTAQLRRNLRHATDHDPRQARPGRQPSCRTGRSCALPGRRSRRATMADLDTHLLTARGRGDARAAASCTGRATPTRPTRSSPSSSRATGADEVVKVKSMATQEIGLNEALGRRRHRRRRDRPRRADRAARRRPARPHPGAGDPPQPRRDPRRSSRARCPASTPASTDDPRRAGRRPPAATCGEKFLTRAGRGLRRQLRRRRDRHAGRGRVRGQRPDVPDAAADARSPSWASRRSCRPGGTSRCSCSCCRGPRPASG